MDDTKTMYRRLQEGAPEARRAYAARLLPWLEGELARVGSEKTAARAAWQRGEAAAGRQADGEPALDQVARMKQVSYAVWTPLVLLVEGFFAYYTASLTLAGGLVFHLVAGITVTLLFCGLAKLAVTAGIDPACPECAAHHLERGVRWAALIAGGLLAVFFVARFTPFAETAFVLTSTGLSFVIACVVAMVWTLAVLYGAPNRLAARHRVLAVAEADLSRLLALARDVAGAEPIGQPAHASGVMAALAILLALSWPVAAEAQELHLWLDVSGSLDGQEFRRVLGLLADPLPVPGRGAFSVLAVTPFWDELDAWQGSPYRLEVPVFAPPRCTPGKTIFTHTRAAREEQCRKAQAEVRASWRAQVDSRLADYRAVLEGIDVTVERPRTCLWPVLRRIAQSPEHSLHLVVTDGVHAGCGPPPDAPLAGPARAVVILLPSANISDVTARMEKRTAELHAHYPALAVIPSWQVDGDFAAALFPETGSQ